MPTTFDTYHRTAQEPFCGLFSAEPCVYPSEAETAQEAAQGAQDRAVDATTRRMKRDVPDYAADFALWVEANPAGYAAMVRYAMEAKHAGKTRYSMDAIFHLVRWEFDVINRVGEFKINNNWTAPAARFIEKNVPALAGFFEHRKASCD